MVNIFHCTTERAMSCFIVLIPNNYDVIVLASSSIVYVVVLAKGERCNIKITYPKKITLND